MVIPSGPPETVERLTLDGPVPVLAYRVGNRVGESPAWDAQRQCLWWIDVRAPAVLRLDPAPALVTRWALPGVVGALALADDGRLALALQHEVVLLDPDRGTVEPLCRIEPERTGNRLNDGKVSPSGRWWLVGSMDDGPAPKQPTGGLFRVGGDGRVKKLHAPLTVANGIAFGPVGDRLYFSDSHAGLVYRADWDEAAGEMGRPEVFATLTEDGGRPDGAAVDAEGHYWSAGVSAGRLNRFSPSGSLVRSLALPCRAPTMPCFAGEALDQLYITSLVRPQWAQPGALDGALLCLPAPAPGLPVPRWRL